MVIIMNTKKIKPSRKLIIKDPRLQAIRDNLRRVIQLAVRDEWQRLMDLQGLYSEKLRINKKELTSHHRRDCQLQAMKEYLLSTFSDSICVCSRIGRLSDSIMGNRVRYTFIKEFDECFVEIFGARYHVREKWFSLEYYEKNHDYLEQYLIKMKNRLKKSPGYITTSLELHVRRLHEIRSEKREYLESILNNF